MSHSSKILQLSSLHYLAHSTEDLMTESGHPVKGTTVLPRCTARNPGVLLSASLSLILLSSHPSPGWPLFLEIPLDSITSMLCPPLPGPSYYLGCPHSYSRPNYNSISSPPFKVLHTWKAELALDMIWLSLLSIHYIWNLIDTLQYFPALLY